MLKTQLINSNVNMQHLAIIPYILYTAFNFIFCLLYADNGKYASK